MYSVIKDLSLSFGTINYKRFNIYLFVEINVCSLGKKN